MLYFLIMQGLETVAKLNKDSSHGSPTNTDIYRLFASTQDRENRGQDSRESPGRFETRVLPFQFRELFYLYNLEDLPRSGRIGERGIRKGQYLPTVAKLHPEGQNRYQPLICRKISLFSDSLYIQKIIQCT